MPADDDANGDAPPAATTRRTTPPRAAKAATAASPPAATAAKKPRRTVQATLGGAAAPAAAAAVAALPAPKATPGNPAPYPPLPAEAAHPYPDPLPPRPDGHYCPAAQRVKPLPPAAYVALSWNVAGLAALLRKDPAAVARLVATERADCLCLQEHKMQEGATPAVEPALGLPPGWHVSWAASTAKKGYSGVAIATRHAPLAVVSGLGLPEADAEGRALAVELPRFWVATVYVPNSGDGLRRLGFRVDPGGWDEALAAWVGALSARSGGKPVLLSGDLNCAREPVDIYAPDKAHEKAAGFTPQERASFQERLLGGAGLVDSLRARIPPDQPAYTYWSYRAGNRPKNRGWRLDYWLAPAAFDAAEVVDAWQLPHVPGSDHCPVGVAVRGGAGD